MKRSLLGLALIASITAADAQPMLVKDINPGSGNNSFPHHLSVFNKKLAFWADDGTNGYELWTSDTSGTNIAFNINPAGASSIPYGASHTLPTVGKYMYFGANNGTSGTELYRWDGTTPPVMIAEIYAGSNSSNIDEVVAMNGKIYFDATDGVYGEELWMFDTMTNAATRLTDIYTGATSSSITNITVYNNKLYFGAFSPTNGQELFSYDPATNATMLVSDIEAGFSSSSPNNMVVINGKLYFTASTSANGRELYSYNGTTVTRLTDVITGSGNGINATGTGVSMIIGMGNAVYFSGNESVSSTGHLYKYDPATGLVTLIYKINPTGNSSINGIVNYNNKIIFSANNGTLGAELWWYRGTGIPTLVGDIRPGAIGSNPTDLTVVGNTLYMYASDSVNAGELFKFFDSTAAGITNVAFTGNVKVYPNPANSNVTVDLSLTETATLSLSLVAITGQVVYSVPATQYTSGNHQVNIPVNNLSAGTYIYTVSDKNGKVMVSGRLLKD
jgi:ELWxxDGT repeat protein